MSTINRVQLSTNSVQRDIDCDGQYWFAPASADLKWLGTRKALDTGSGEKGSGRQEM